MKSQSEITKRRYDRYSYFYNLIDYPAERFLFQRWRQQVISSLGGRILELGIGTGKNLRHYAKNTKITGIDISPKMLRRARKEDSRLKRNDSLLQMDAQELKFPSDSFDIVFCTFLLCSVPNPIGTVREMSRVCKLNGQIVMIEHVLSKNEIIAFFQHLHNPITKYLLGVNITRDTIANISKAGAVISSEINLMSNDIFKLIICKPTTVKDEKE